jgi:hypothetical protein
MATIITSNPPEILAKKVFSYLKGNDQSLNREMLRRLVVFFKILYYASMRTEESQHIKVMVSFFNPNSEDLVGDEEDSKDHWSFTSFKEPLQFNEKTLVKLSKAADPWSSAIAVYFDDEENLMIYGLIDQVLHHQRFMNHESEMEPDYAGLFQASIQGIGLITVTDGNTIVGELRQDSIANNFLDVWKYGQISDIIKKSSRTFINQIEVFLSTTYPMLRIEDHEEFITNLVRDTLSRILIQIKNYGHGGALVITSEIKGLKIGYPMRYKRLRFAMLRLIKTTISLKQIQKKISRSRDLVSKDFLNISRELEKKKVEIDNELKGAIRFIASQSCVDGLIVMETNFITSGFGAVIDKVNPPEKIYLSKTSKFSIPEEIDTNNFGTRHRSMMTYCSMNPGSIGIVISQDGELRVISQFEEKLVMWENVKTQKYLRISAIAH